MYAPGAISSDLLDAHETLDRTVNGLFGFGSAVPTELEQQERLFAGYQESAAPLTAAVQGLRKR